MLADTIPGIRVVKAFAQEKREIERFRAANLRIIAANDRVNKVWCRPAGDNKITRVFSRFKFSTASKSGPGFNNIPGPPPNGRSSTVLCRSCVQSRRLWTFRSSRPAARARLTMLSSSGPANIAGNKVSTSIFIQRVPGSLPAKPFCAVRG